MFMNFCPLVGKNTRCRVELVTRRLVGSGRVFCVSVKRTRGSMFCRGDVGMCALDLRPCCCGGTFVCCPIFSHVQGVLSVRGPSLVCREVLGSFSFRLTSCTDGGYVPFCVRVTSYCDLMFRGGWRI